MECRELSWFVQFGHIWQSLVILNEYLMYNFETTLKVSQLC